MLRTFYVFLLFIIPSPVLTGDIAADLWHPPTVRILFAGNSITRHAPVGIHRGDWGGAAYFLVALPHHHQWMVRQMPSSPTGSTH